MDLVFLLDAAQDGNGVFNRGFLYQHLLKTTLKRCVLFDIFPVFVQGGSADTVQFTAR